MHHVLRVGLLTLALPLTLPLPLTLTMHHVLHVGLPTLTLTLTLTLTMHHVLRVQVGDARHDLNEEASRLGLAAAPVLHDVLEQLALCRESATRARTLGPPMRGAATS